MRAATFFYAVEVTSVVIAMAILMWIGYEANGRIRAATLVEILIAADTSDVPERLAPLDDYARWTRPLLHRWADTNGNLIPTGAELAEQAHTRAERLAEQLRALGVEPEV